MENQIYNIIKENLFDFGRLCSYEQSFKLHFIMTINGVEYDSELYNVYLSPFGLDFERKHDNSFFHIFCARLIT